GAAGCGSEAGAPRTASSEDVGAGSDPTTWSDPFDAHWMQRMIDHHLMAVEMAELCLADDPVHEEFIALCENVEATQTAEIALMRGWLEEWYGLAYEGGSGGMMGMGMGASADLEDLSGEAFELAFMREMIPHHRQAVHMSEVCVRRAAHEELRALCEEIVTAQTAEIEDMTGWLCDWYGLCSTGGVMGGGGMPGGGPMGGGPMHR
ncbi:MAG TPA: DUF305 domain-containing protein, partial [Anaeromyxobacteraceae bacterium]|nr:DUF305 domain-containing protein [Anaeromyxobacteraceae bacterium]